MSFFFSFTWGRRGLLAACLAAVVSRDGSAQTGPRDLANATLEDLMNIEITSAARKEQRAFDTPAAIFVISRDDIRRSGLRTLPELFRLVPGMQVARINGNNWAISIRGFNDLLADKVLVLIDGRTIYNPLFAGVFWDMEDVMLEDVERIEVIRGPGGAVWGANSANGVINVITRSAADTRGVAARVGAGAPRQGDTAIRFGGALGRHTAYRLFSQWSSHGESRTAGDQPAGDSWRNLTAGGRADWSSGAHAATVDGKITWGDRHALWLDRTRLPQLVPFDGGSGARTGHVLGRWTLTRPRGGSFRLQSFVDAIRRTEPIGAYDRVTLDGDAEYHGPIGRRHDLVIGGGFRHIVETFHGEAGWTLSLRRQRNQIVNAFAQDEVAVTSSRSVAVSLGAKLEHDTVVGTSLQPSARVMWRIGSGSQRLWAAASRAVRTPSLIDRQVDISYPFGTDPSGLPIVSALRGNPALRDETVYEREVGYRLPIGSSVTLDVTAFHAHYDDLRTAEVLTPVFEAAPTPRIVAGVRFDNLLKAETTGFEAAAQWQPLRAWRLEGHYSAFRMTPYLDPASRDSAAAATQGKTPSQQWRLRSAFAFGDRATADVSLWRVGAIRRPPVPAYLRADARVEWRFAAGVSLEVEGQNLFDRRHLEFNTNTPTVLATPVSRTVGVRLTWVLTR